LITCYYFANEKRIKDVSIVPLLSVFLVDLTWVKTSIISAEKVITCASQLYADGTHKLKVEDLNVTQFRPCDEGLDNTPANN